LSSSGDDKKPQQALDNLFSTAYKELTRLAAAIRRVDANATISTATLVHEAWLKLASGRFAPESPLHLKHVVAQAMRQIGMLSVHPFSKGMHADRNGQLACNRSGF
jgi:hypothetical protein